MPPVPHLLPAVCGASIAVLVPGGDTMARAGDPASVIRGWVHALGFDGLSYFGAPHDVAPGSATATSWSTWGETWDREHRSRGYADVDPRVVATLEQSLPCLWDGAMIVPRGHLARFLRDAAGCGIRSGVAIPIGTARQRALVAFDSSIAPMTPARRAAILDRLGDMLWVAHAVHASRHPSATTLAAPIPEPSRTLSGRERACLAMSARGLTSRDIGAKLGIATRTVDFHFGNVLAKLAASNRHEAIAKAIARGWLAH
ncbi:MAG: autoinducer binding domain-containing protein [Betaproteobacteria bacterium]